MSALTFYFDFISPYAYLAWRHVRPLGQRHGRAVDAVPILFAALLDANGQKGPAEIPAKRAHTWKDVMRTARRVGAPIAPPATHPFNPLLALRVAANPAAGAQRDALIDALYAATWAEGLDVTDAAVVARVVERAGLDGAAFVAWAATPEAKALVRTRTDEALARGVFGVPTVLADGELFWGFDTFPNLEAFLRGEDRDLMTPEVLARWMALAPSASRKALGQPPRAPSSRAR
jgi:2-hydroxychromene-2-carboxylate isomerase